jgi:hypothetical protein
MPTVTCPGCKNNYEVKPNHVGLRIECSICASQFKAIPEQGPQGLRFAKAARQTLEIARIGWANLSSRVGPFLFRFARNVFAAFQGTGAAIANHWREATKHNMRSSPAVLPTETEQPVSDTKKCSFCSEEIKYQAVKCKHCGELLDGRREKSTRDPAKGSGSGSALLQMLGGILLPIGYGNCARRRGSGY